jgi:EAL domain-containing protein (putative c-di-GMP-specific phosphodiesterase class I)
VRWREPDGEVRLPSEFLVHAEETGIILALGRWAIEAALRDAQAWRAQGLEIPVAVNLSARQLQDPELVNHVFRALQSTQLPARLLRLEVTEAVLVRDLAAADRSLRSLKGLGVELVLDNFGADQASLAFVTRFGARSVKLERGLVSSGPQKRESVALVHALVAMARTLELRVIAEGVETEEERDEAEALGLHAGQGFFFGKPVDGARVPRLAADATVPLQ